MNTITIEHNIPVQIDDYYTYTNYCIQKPICHCHELNTVNNSCINNQVINLNHQLNVIDYDLFRDLLFIVIVN